MALAASLMLLGVRAGWWVCKQPFRLARLGGREMAGAAAFTVSYWAGLVMWFALGLLALYAAALARQVGWLTPAAWALSATGILFWLSLLVYLRTRAIRNNARTRAMMRRMFEATQQTAEKVEQVEQAVTAGTRRGPDVLGALRSAGTDSERQAAALFAEQAAAAREWTGGPPPVAREPVFGWPWRRKPRKEG